MSIYNFNTGQEYISIDKVPDQRSDVEKLFTPLAIFNHDNVDIAYAERSAEELVNISGAWVTIFLRTNSNGTIDEVWDEDADPTYKNGVKLKGFFVPEPIATELTKWGVDSPNRTKIIFSRAVLIKAFSDKRLPRPGDVIEVPHNTLTAVQFPGGLVDGKLDKYRVIDSQDVGNFKFRWLYYSCDIENLTGDKTIQIEHR